MAYPASQRTLQSVLDEINATALRVRANLTSVRNASAAGPIARQQVIDVQRDLARGVERLTTLSTTPGLAAYAQEQFNNPSLNVAAEFTTMLAAMVSLRDWVFANFPKDAGSGAWLVYSYDANGVATSLTFSSADLAQWRTRVDAVAAAIS
jgi:hypothetical protein